MRTRVLSILIFIMFMALITALVYTQIFNYVKYLTLSQNNRVRLMPIESQRGRFFDRNGILLVANRPSFDVFIIPQELNSVKALGRLSAILGITASEIFKTVDRKYTVPFAPVLIKEDVDKEAAIAIEQESLNMPGVIVKVSPRREYKFKEAGSHIFGYLGEIDKWELDRLRDYGYQISDLIGKSGLEKYYDNYLKGEDGGMQLEVNNKGYFIKSLGRKEALPGKDLFLTIDIRLQVFIENLLAGKVAACVVMSPQTGEVFALVSRPDFDPGLFVGRERSDQISQLFKEPDRPMIDRAISGLYPPGSVFKPAIACAGLEKKVINAESTFVCEGKYTLGNVTFACWDPDGHGVETVREGLKNSCNVFFYQLGRAIGVDDIASYAQRFGYGSPTGIDLPGESGGIVPTRSWKRLVKKAGWFEGDTVNYAIGQGYLMVTPIQVARMIACIGNGGNLVMPYLVKKIGGVEVVSAKSRYIGLSKNTVDIVKDGLRAVIEDPTGTGRKARVEGLSIAGKTGTAQNKGLSHAWFCGFSPIDTPKVAVVVFVENGGKGGLAAAEPAGLIFKKAQELGLL